ncbi:O-glycosyl hydrolase [Paenibacillus phyllosphaerae]|uniref:O-glycosyl hydrolase n=1 Tax=Paenibacillus phyllosphaerae TaxID=274593 RepID=A0A7W5FPM1_9BACL|nr:glycoside hydrolase [Paenibacillus phyllosphaerae]MBB3112510.1 O-glycosyl hydrolase [Paenibacillus phyllosphaerae]
MKRKQLKKGTAAILAGVCGLSMYGGPGIAHADVTAAEEPDALVTIDASQKFQVIDNFGASDAWSMEQLGKHWTEANKERVADLLFSRDKGIGLSAWRFNIGAGSTETDQTIITNPWRRAEAFKQTEGGAYDWSKQSGQQWFLQAAKDRGVDTLIAFVNSPPVWMTKNGHGQPDASVGSTNLKAGYEDEFAAFLIDVLAHFKEQGLEFDYISPINEPTWDWNKAGQEGNRYNNDDIRKVILELYRQLQEKGITSQISAPDGVEITALLDDAVFKEFTGNDRYTGGANALGLGKYREYIKDLLSDPEMKEAVGSKIASHSYWSDYSNPGDDRLGELRELLADNLAAYGDDVKYWMSEYCILGSYGPGRDLGIDPALYIARTIHFDMTKANASAWQWWTAVSKEDYKDGLIYTDFNLPGDEQNILPSKMLWALGNYSKFIRPGAERVELTGLDEEARSGLLGSAYQDENEETVTAVFVNDGAEDKTIKVQLSGLENDQTVMALKPYITSAGEDLARGEDALVQADGTFEAVIPARSIVTLNGDIIDAAETPAAPELTQVTPLNKGLKVEFESAKGATQYEISYKGEHETEGKTVTVTSEGTALLEGLQNGKAYTITVRAGNANGYGPPSTVVTATPQLLAPAIVTASAADGAFTAAFAAESGVPAYRVRYGTEPGTYTGELQVNASEGSIQVDGLTNGTTYYGVVEAVDGNEVSPPSNAFSVKPDVAAPGKIIAIPGDRKAHLEFAPVEGALGYNVQFVNAAAKAAPIESLNREIDLKALANDVPVTVRVSTVGKGGAGTGYTEATVTPRAEEVRFEDYLDSGKLDAYQQDVSTWVMEDGLLKHVSGGDHQGELSVKDLNVIDGTITVVAQHANAAADWGVTFRSSAAGKGYWFGFENGAMVLRKDGANLTTPVPFSARLGELYKLEVKLSGKHIQALLDDKVIFDVNDSLYTSGRVGLHSWADAAFASFKVTRDAASFAAVPEIYEVKAGDRQIALQYSEVEGASSYAIQYAPVSGGESAPVEIPANPRSTIVTGLTNDTAYSFKVIAIRENGRAESTPTVGTPKGSPLLYYVDAGDATPSQVEEGEQLGSMQSSEEQPYGTDPITGMKWGYQADDGSTWAHTSPLDAYETIRQYDGTVNGKGLAYRFQVPNGAYKVTVGFFDPWHANDRVMDLTINGTEKLSDYVIGTKRESHAFEDIEVTDGELIVKAVKSGNSKPMISWIKVEKAEDVEVVRNTLTISGPESAQSGQSVDVTVGLQGANEDFLAQDLTVQYDADRLELIGSELAVLDDRYQLVGQEEEPGSVRLLLVKTGTGESAAGNDLLKLRFKVKEDSAAGIASISLTDASAANGEGVETPLTGASTGITISAIDKAALRALITEAQAKYDSTPTGSSVGQAPAAAKTALAAAISTASAVVGGTGSTQAQVEQAAVDLNAALEAFKAAIIKKQPGDVNEDDKVSIGDLALVAAAYGKTSADADWATVAKSDVNGDGKIDIEDLAALAKMILEQPSAVGV